VRESHKWPYGLALRFHNNKYNLVRRSRERVMESSRNAKKALESMYGVVTVCWRVKIAVGRAMV
jgi:hypothetical protein